MRIWSRLIICFAGTILSVGIVRAAPRAATIASAWQLDFDFHDPQRIELTRAGGGSPVEFWYLLFRVTNNTGQDVQFFPSIRLVTDTLDVVPAGDNINPTVYDLIAARHRDEFPFLAPPNKITGPLLQGEENSRSSVAVFRRFDPQADSFTIHVSGISGEITRIANPAFDRAKVESPENPRSFTLRRTLTIRYGLPGDETTSDAATAIRLSREWVMR
jgi:hypothetical protein